MNAELNLYEVIQNNAIGALACHSFVLGYHMVAKKKSKPNYPKLTFLFYVLPIVYHKRTREVFKSSNELYTAILADKEIILGLQERANKMSSQTFDSLNIAFSKKILRYNHTSKRIELERGFKNKISIGNIDREHPVKRIQESAYKLGHIFAKNSENNIQTELNILF